MYYTQQNYDEGESSDEYLESLKRHFLEAFAGDEELSNTIRSANAQQMYHLTIIFPAMWITWSHLTGNVWDEIQNNPRLIIRRDATQCPNAGCGKYFWKDRKLSHCTYCATHL